MSSILEALKKVEQESSATDEGQGPWPLPASLPVFSPNRHRWWLAIGAVAVLLMIVAVYGWIRRPAATDPLVAAKTGSPETEQPTVKATPAVPSVSQVPAPAPQVTVIPSPRQGSPVNIRPRDVQPAIHPKAPAPSLPPPATIQTQGATTTVRSPVRPPAPASENHDFRPADPPAADGQARRETPAPLSHDSPPPLRDDAVAFRKDSRIELQALVWAPEASDRFVVINNRLIKEGGSMDNIVVIKINRDDVLLSEGTDRWHQPFEIR